MDCQSFVPVGPRLGGGGTMVDVGSTMLNAGFLAMGNFLHASFSPEWFSYYHKSARGRALDAEELWNRARSPPRPRGLTIMDRNDAKARSADAPEAHRVLAPFDRLAHLSDHTLSEPLAQLRPQHGSSAEARPHSHLTDGRNSGGTSSAAHDRPWPRRDHASELPHSAGQRDATNASPNSAHKDGLHRAPTSTLTCITTTTTA